jgi:hypothetical protein
MVHGTFNLILTVVQATADGKNQQERKQQQQQHNQPTKKKTTKQTIEQIIQTPNQQMLIVSVYRMYDILASFAKLC